MRLPPLRSSRLLLPLLLLPALLAARSSAPPEPEQSRYQLGLLWRGPQWTAERTLRTDSIQVAPPKMNITKASEPMMPMA